MNQKKNGNMTVIIYTKKACPACVRAKRLLTEHGYEFNEILVTKQTKHKLLERVPEAKTVPQIFMNEVHIGGCDDLQRYLKENKNVDED